MKRFLRDDGMIKVSRSLKETGHKAYAAKEQLEKQMGREPTLSEIAAAIEVPEEELVEAMDAGAQIESLQQTIYQSEGNSIELMDKLKEEGDSQETALDRIVLTEVLGTLNAKERELIYKRYFQDMTQTAIAREMGMTQVQVSRMEKRFYWDYGESCCDFLRIFCKILILNEVQIECAERRESMTRKRIVVWLVVLVLTCAAGIGCYLWQRGNEKEKSGGMLVERMMDEDVAI